MKNVFDIEQFNELYNEGDLLALEYLKPFVPKELEDRYEAVLELNYANASFESGLLEGSIYDVYSLNKEQFLRDLGLVSIVCGNENKYMQNKLLKEEIWSILLK